MDSRQHVTAFLHAVDVVAFPFAAFGIVFLLLLATQRPDRASAEPGEDEGGGGRRASALTLPVLVAVLVASGLRLADGAVIRPLWLQYLLFAGIPVVVAVVVIALLTRRRNSDYQ